MIFRNADGYPVICIVILQFVAGVPGCLVAAYLFFRDGAQVFRLTVNYPLQGTGTGMLQGHLLARGQAKN